MDYERTAHTVADRLLGYTKDGSGWKPCKKTNEVVVYWRPSTEFPGNLYKGDGLVRGAVRAVWECLKPAPGGLRLQWDRNVDQFELLEKVSELPT